LGFFITFIAFQTPAKIIKMKLNLFVFTTVLFVSISFAQEATKNENTSLSGEFEKLYRISTNYQKYKVIDKEKFLTLKQQVLDSLKTAQNQITKKNNLLKEAQKNIGSTQETLRQTKLELETTLQKKNTISLFGKSLSKTLYSILLWSLILVLLAGLLYFIFKFTKNNMLTKRAEENLKDIEIEYEQYRKKALEREQKLRRTLQDEINKQRNS
jgi:preprotein translocase subunit SecF